MRILRLFLLTVFAGAFLSACVTSTPSERPSPTREANARTPFTAATPSGRREAPELSELYARFKEEEVRVAILLPLSGPAADVGQAFLDSAAMALFESYDPRLQLFPIDTRGTPEGARAAARDAIEREADVVLGPLFSESIAAAGPILRNAGIKVIGFSNNPEVAGGGVYLLNFLPEQETRRVVAFAAKKGHENFAALIPDSPYGATVLDSFSKAVNRSGKSIAALEIYERQPDAFMEPVKRLANYDERREAYLAEERFLENLGNDDLAKEILDEMEPLETIGDPPFDAVLVPEGGQMLRSLIPLLPFYEVDPGTVKFLGTGLWYDPALPGEPTLVGAWFAGGDPEKIEAFMARFRGLYGYRPPRIATLPYDAMALVASLARIEVPRHRFSADTLEDVNGFTGIDGIFRFRPDGTVERGFAVLEITNKGFKVVDPAPKSFTEKP